MTESRANDSQQTAPPRRRRLLRIIGILFGLLVLAVGALALWIPSTSRYQVEGDILISGLTDTIKIIRDEKGMPYIHAGSMRDAMFGQGFVTAQDRLFQIQLMRLQAEGRLTELAGEVAKDLDIRNRTIGIAAAAEKHAQILDEPSREIFQAYVDGINAFLDECPDDLPREFKLAGITPDRWAVKDSLSILYLMSWDTSANLNHEIVGQMLLDQLGTDRAAELMPLNINPDWPSEQARPVHRSQRTMLASAVINDPMLQALGDVGPLRVGSNNWTTGPTVSVGENAMVVGDPHLDPRILPGIMYSVGFVLPDSRAVGAGAPGIPGFIVGRNEHAAIAVTNNYGDVQDLYIETIDPNNGDHYREGGKSIPFAVETQTLKIKDSAATEGFRDEEIQIRFTSRGPVVSDVLKGVGDDKVLSLRWAAVEAMQPRLNLTELLTAKSVDDIDAAIESVTSIVLNFVYADIDGNISWRASGRVPIRKPDGGALPTNVSADEAWKDNWQGWIPFDEMPHQRNPGRGWLGTANHYTIPADYPHYYTNYASPSYRYRRLKQRIAEKSGELTVDDHWSIQRDTKNLMAESVTPILIEALASDETTVGLADVLKNWNFHDDVDQAGPTVFQTVYTEFAKITFQDELGDSLTEKMLSNWYFWQERFERLVLAGNANWFDDTTTDDATENINNMIIRGGRGDGHLQPRLGNDPNGWLWGKVHTMQWVNPIRREGIGTDWLGTIPYPVGGSGETLYRGWYDYGNPFGVTHTAAVRMVVDFGDREKVRAVMAGGEVARTFHPHQKDQIDAYLTGQPLHWWLSDEAIAAGAKSTLTLTPKR